VQDCPKEHQSYVQDVCIETLFCTRKRQSLFGRSASRKRPVQCYGASLYTKAGLKSNPNENKTCFIEEFPWSPEYGVKINVGLNSPLTHPSSWALPEKLPVLQLLKNLAFYGTRRFITLFRRALHWSLSWGRSIQSVPSHPLCLRSILILPTHTYVLVFLVVSFFLAFSPISYMHSSYFPHSCYMLCPSHPP
jgi:hypothetical protein